MQYHAFAAIQHLWIALVHVLGQIFQAKFNGTKLRPLGRPQEGQQALPHQGRDQVDGEV